MDLKGYIRDKIEERADETYAAKLEEKRMSFDSWIRICEDGLERMDMTVDREKAISESSISYITHFEGTTIRILPFSAVTKNFQIKPYLEDIIVFANGELTDRAIPLIVKAFISNPSRSIVYGDEDLATITDEKDQYGRTVYGTRHDPYFKPDWSPNAFLSHFYFCNIVALRRVTFRETVWEEGLTGASAIYRMLLGYIYENELNLRKSVHHIDQILIHAENYDNNDLTDEKSREKALKLKVRSYGYEGYKMLNKTMVSVVIPSKDNPEMLERCISSLKDACPGAIVPQIIVVDNGSNDENKKIIGEMALKYDFRYEYRPMEFNFARMCNIGASFGTGEYLLLLNDDVYFTEAYTLETMLEQASYKFTGAVGAKLLYPDSSMIQHAGVINNRIGPVHKLQFADDEVNHYFGFNRYPQNVMAVTAACLLVRRDVFDKVEGLNEGFRVAFNDIDLCFKIYEEGYFNVCCNEIHLCHAESVSRGKDTSSESLKRLLKEKHLLYEEHPVFKVEDPFYNKYLTADVLDTRIVPACGNEYGRILEKAEKRKITNLSKAREDACVILNVEYAGLLSEYTYDAESNPNSLYVQGFAFVTGSDNACYRRSLLLKREDCCYELSFSGSIRNDVAANCPDQKNVEMSGYALEIPAGMIPAGVYTIGVMCTRVLGHEKIYVFSNRELVVE